MADDVIPKWPPRLPRPVLNGYGYQPKSPFIRTNMDAGNARQRRRFRTFPTTVSVTWALTGEQFELFEAFVHYDLLDGACWFMTPLANGQGMSSVRARFMADPPYNVTPVASSLGLWTVTAQLEAVTMPVATYDKYIELDLGSQLLIDLANQLDHAVNVVRPGAE